MRAVMPGLRLFPGKIHLTAFYPARFRRKHALDHWSMVDSPGFTREDGKHPLFLHDHLTELRGCLLYR